MTPKKKYYRTAYWDCGEGHRHKTNEAAQKCIAKQEATSAVRAKAVDKTEVISLFNKGRTMTEIAWTVGRSPARIGQIIAKEQRRIRVEQRQAIGGSLEARTAGTARSPRLAA